MLFPPERDTPGLCVTTWECCIYSAIVAYCSKFPAPAYGVQTLFLIRIPGYYRPGFSIIMVILIIEEVKVAGIVKITY